MPCPIQKCACESPALRNVTQEVAPPGKAGIIFGACECVCHVNAAAELEAMNPTEALFGFVSWCTVRPEVLKIGASEDAAPWAKLVDEYVKTNRLPLCREGWQEKIRTPREESAEEVATEEDAG